MPPTPQSTLPLPPQPKVEQFETLAEDLLEACTREPASAPGPQAPDAIERWAQRWLESLAEAVGYRRGPTRDVVRIDVLGRVEEVAQFARERMAASCALSEAQAVIALWHGLPTWAAFVSHVESLAQPGPEVAGFEAAAEAIISGDIPTLTRLLREQPTLIRARSTREHQATLLHYVSANGVEGYRQISPQNIAEITKILLDAGAEVDARANVYGGGWTALGLVATSEPPRKAGVQLAVIDVLLEAGARMDLLGMRGDLNEPLLRACLANGQDEAATHLLDRGAPVDFTAAAGVGRLDLVERLVDDAEDVREGFLFACGYGHRTVVEFLLDRAVGVDVNVWFHGRSGLHDAAYHGHVDVVDLLVTRGADLDRIDDTYHTAPLIWALTGWQRKRRIDPSRYYKVVARLVAAGAKVRPDLLEWDQARADPQMMAALNGQAGPERAGPERAGSGQA
jgi:ankyrin repeat protein